MLWLLAIPALAIGVLIAVRMLVHHEPAPPTAVDPNIEENPPVVETAPPVVENKPPVVETKQPVPEPPPPPPIEQPIKPVVKQLKKPVIASPPKLVTPPPAVVTHRAFIGSQPWSYFTVDNGATTYESNNAIQLAPGPHTIHYVGQPHFKADRTITIDMPDKDGFTHVEQLKAPTPPASP